MEEGVMGEQGSRSHLKCSSYTFIASQLLWKPVDMNCARPDTHLYKLSYLKRARQCNLGNGHLNANSKICSQK